MQDIHHETFAGAEQRARDMKSLDIGRLEEKVAKASGLLKAMSNERRLMILCRLAMGELSVGELAKQVGLGQSSLSQHLAVLRRKGMVETRRETRMIYYRLASHEANAIMMTLYDLYCREAFDDGPE